jgi:hypothetical protein
MSASRPAEPTRSECTWRRSTSGRRRPGLRRARRAASAPVPARVATGVRTSDHRRAGETESALPPDLQAALERFAS